MPFDNRFILQGAAVLSRNSRCCEVIMLCEQGETSKPMKIYLPETCLPDKVEPSDLYEAHGVLKGYTRKNKPRFYPVAKRLWKIG